MKRALTLLAVAAALFAGCATPPPNRSLYSPQFLCAVKGAVSQWAEMPTRQLSLLPVAVGAVVIRPT